MAGTPILTVDGEIMPVPLRDGWTINYENIYSFSAQSETGDEMYKRIKKQRAVIDIEWDGLTGPEVEAIRHAMAPNYFVCDYYFGTTVLRTKKFKCESGFKQTLSVLVHNYKGTTDQTSRWKLSVQIKEVGNV